jgi:membrane-associated phospholipid phosphatase
MGSLGRLLFFTAFSLLTASITTFLKRLTKRDRPPAASLAHKIFNIRALETNFSFPSGDSAQGAVIACNLFYYAQAFAGHSEPDVWAGFLLLLIPITMSARVYFGAHYWSDTIAGVCIGWLATVTSWAAIEHLLGWKFGSPADRVHAFMSHAGFIKGLHVH